MGGIPAGSTADQQGINYWENQARQVYGRPKSRSRSGGRMKSRINIRSKKRR